ncbi:hypothetical protein Hanom_Chr02g00157821 [Helianthus anomalus]
MLFTLSNQSAGTKKGGDIIFNVTHRIHPTFRNLEESKKNLMSDVYNINCVVEVM